MITIVATVLLFCSCKKGSVETVNLNNDMVEAAKLLDGPVLSGNVTTESNETEMVINYNDGNKFILVQKLPSNEQFNINSIKSAEVITSKFGIILKDLINNKIFLLANNDSESLKIFETIKPIFGKNARNTSVFGVTIVNAEKG